MNGINRNVVVLYLRLIQWVFGYFFFHCRSRLPFQSKVAELSWYRPFGIVCDCVISFYLLLSYHSKNVVLYNGRHRVFFFSAILCHHFHRPALRASRRIVVLQYFYLAFSGLFSCLFSFSDPAYRISKCFLLSDLFSAYETCFRFPASVEVSRRFLRPPFNGIPVLPRLALLRPTFSAHVVLYEAFLLPSFSSAYVLADARPCPFRNCASVLTSRPFRVPCLGP